VWWERSDGVATAADAYWHCLAWQCNLTTWQTICSAISHYQLPSKRLLNKNKSRKLSYHTRLLTLTINPTVSQLKSRNNARRTFQQHKIVVIQKAFRSDKSNPSYLLIRQEITSNVTWIQTTQNWCQVNCRVLLMSHSLNKWWICWQSKWFITNKKQTNSFNSP